MRGTAEPVNNSYGAALFVTGLDAFPTGSTDQNATGNLTGVTFAENIGLPVWDDDTDTVGRWYNAVTYNGNNFHSASFPDGSGGFYVYGNSIAGVKSTAALNSLVVARVNFPDTDKSTTANGFTATAPVELAVRAVPPAKIAVTAAGDPAGETASFAGFAWSGGSATFDGVGAEDLARTLELYTPDGQPDITRARKVAAVMRKSADDETARKMAPVLQSMAAGQSGTLKAQYATIKDKAGRTVNPQVLEQLWSIVPPELVARDPQVAGVLYYAAKGYAAHHGLDEPTPPPRAPILSQASGGGRPAAPALTSFDQAMRKAMQVTEKAYTETGSRFKSGSINVLED